MVEVQEQTFASVKKTAAEDVVINKGRGGVENDVPDEGKWRPAGFAFGRDEFAYLGAVAVHVLQIQVHGGVGVVEHVSAQCAALALKLRSAVRADTFAEAR